jgi:predicted ArsR family transcriptional regulator
MEISRLDQCGPTQRRLLETLLQPQGTTVENMVTELGITTTAVRQHLTTLERDGLIVRTGTQPTRGRPELLYNLSPSGHEMFPRQYLQLAENLLEDIAENSDAASLQRTMQRMGTRAGNRIAAGKTASIEQTAAAMRAAGYEAHVSSDGPRATPEIVAHNCVFHKLAEQFPAVCSYDLALMEAATGRAVDHRECMIRGGNSCRFRFGKSGSGN